MPQAQIVEHDNAFTALHERSRNMRPNIAGAAGDEESHGENCAQMRGQGPGIKRL